MSGSTSTGRVICGTDLAECVSVPGDFLRPQGAFPQAFTPFRGGLGSLPGAWGAPNKGTADGAEGIFGKLRARVGYGPAPGPTQKKGLVPYMPVRWGVHQIPQLGWTQAEGVGETRFSPGRSTTEA